MIYLSFDLGLSHTGVAISHEGVLVEGLTTISGPPEDLADKIMKLINLHHPDEVVLGYPSRGPINSLAKKLQETLSTLTSVPVILHNEDSSSRLSQKMLFDARQTVAKRVHKNHLAAACFLLQEYLDLKSHLVE